MNNPKLRAAAEERAASQEQYVLDIREKAALIANNATDEKERFLGRQIILLCEQALIIHNSAPVQQNAATAQTPAKRDPKVEAALLLSESNSWLKSERCFAALDDLDFAVPVNVGDANDVNEELTRILAAEVRRLESQGQVAAVDAWRTGTPDVKERGLRRFICVTRGSPTGKEYVRELCYVNKYIMPLADSQDEAPKGAEPVGDDGDYAWTGWFETSCSHCDTQWAYDCEVVRWMEMPAASDGKGAAS